ncbi:MAG: MBL fold metallo-hydrolase [Lachnospiraceae bacterium]|nr:MBL fold metallo-hydrolase [Lachnospiraceae bacterium]
MSNKIQKLTFYWVNAFIIRTDACTVLWDTGCLPEGETLSAFLEANGLLSDGQLRLPGESTPLKIDYIVLSHAHYDHCSLAEEWRTLTGAKIIAHEKGLDYLTTGRKEDPFVFNHMAQADVSFMAFIRDNAPDPMPTCRPDILVGDEGLDMHAMGFPGRLVYTPGHTADAMTLATDDGSVFSGDTISEMHLLGNLQDKFAPGIFGANWMNIGDDVIRESCRRILELGDRFYLGHGEPRAKQELGELMFWN